MLAITNPLPQFFDLDGSPLEGGKLYFGTPYQNPEQSPVTVYWDVGGTQPAAQPVRTTNGYAARIGSPAQVFSNGDYSLTVRDKRGRLVLYAPSSAEFSNDQLLQDQITAISSSLSSTTNAAAGAGLLGFGPTLNYVAGTIGAAMQDNMVNVMWFLTQAERAQVKAGTATIDLTAKINAAKSWGAGRPLYLPAGTWSFTTFDGKGWYGGLVGDGMTQTILKVRTATTTAIDFAETTDVSVSPFVIKGLTIDGDSKAATLVDVRYRHHYVIEDVLFKNATEVCLNAKDTWLNTHRNCRFQKAPTLVWLRGSNHRNLFQSCAFSSNTVWQLQVDSGGTAADGNEALLFSNCDFEFSDPAGGGIRFAGTSGTFLSCYMGENLEGPALQAEGGAVEVLGGVMFFGHTTSTIGVKTNGGKTRVMGARLNGQTNGSLRYLMDGSGGLGTVQFLEVLGNMIISGDQTVAGNPLDYGPPGVVFGKRLGRNWTASGNNATVTPVVAGNQINVACSAAPGPLPTMTVTNLLTQVRPEWREGEKLYLIIVYQSNAAFNVRLSGGALGASPTVIIGTMPSTGGATTTYIKFDLTIPTPGLNYDRIEVYRDNVAVGESISIIESFVADSRMLDPGTSNVGNLYKC
jgi:hypothetical protein